MFIKLLYLVLLMEYDYYIFIKKKYNKYIQYGGSKSDMLLNKIHILDNYIKILESRFSKLNLLNIPYSNLLTSINKKLYEINKIKTNYIKKLESDSIIDKNLFSKSENKILSLKINKPKINLPIITLPSLKTNIQNYFDSLQLIEIKINSTTNIEEIITELINIDKNIENKILLNNLKIFKEYINNIKEYYINIPLNIDITTLKFKNIDEGKDEIFINELVIDSKIDLKEDLTIFKTNIKEKLVTINNDLSFEKIELKLYEEYLKKIKNINIIDNINSYKQQNQDNLLKILNLFEILNNINIKITNLITKNKWDNNNLKLELENNITLIKEIINKKDNIDSNFIITYSQDKLLEIIKNTNDLILKINNYIKSLNTTLTLVTDKISLYKSVLEKLLINKELYAFIILKYSKILNDNKIDEYNNVNTEKINEITLFINKYEALINEIELFNLIIDKVENININIVDEINNYLINKKNEYEILYNKLELLYKSIHELIQNINKNFNINIKCDYKCISNIKDISKLELINKKLLKINNTLLKYKIDTTSFSSISSELIKDNKEYRPQLQQIIKALTKSSKSINDFYILLNEIVKSSDLKRFIITLFNEKIIILIPEIKQIEQELNIQTGGSNIIESLKKSEIINEIIPKIANKIQNFKKYLQDSNKLLQKFNILYIQFYYHKLFIIKYLEKIIINKDHIIIQYITKDKIDKYITQIENILNNIKKNKMDNITLYYYINHYITLNIVYNFLIKINSNAELNLKKLILYDNSYDDNLQKCIVLFNLIKNILDK